MSIKFFEGQELQRIKIVDYDINLGDYSDLKEDYDNQLPKFIINENGDAVIKKDTELYYSKDPAILMDENDENIDVYLVDDDYIII